MTAFISSPKPIYWWNDDQLKQLSTFSKGKNIIAAIRSLHCHSTWNVEGFLVEHVISSNMTQPPSFYMPKFSRSYSPKPIYWWNDDQLKQLSTFSKGKNIVSAILSLQCHPAWNVQGLLVKHMKSSNMTQPPSF